MGFVLHYRISFFSYTSLCIGFIFISILISFMGTFTICFRVSEAELIIKHSKAI